MTKKKDLSEKISEYLKDYFRLLDAGEVDFEVEKNDDLIKVKLMTNEDSVGLLIGNKGRNLYSLQTILRSTFIEDLKELKLILDVDNWREKEEDRLKGLAQKTADRARETKQPQTLYNLTPSQRRVVHMYLSEEKDITTESFGEDKDRYLVVSPK